MIKSKLDSICVTQLFYRMGSIAVNLNLPLKFHQWPFAPNYSRCSDNSTSSCSIISWACRYRSLIKGTKQLYPPRLMRNIKEFRQSRSRVFTPQVSALVLIFLHSLKLQITDPYIRSIFLLFSHNMAFRLRLCAPSWSVTFSASL